MARPIEGSPSIIQENALQPENSGKQKIEFPSLEVKSIGKELLSMF
jgi:hypothetical protein